MFAFFCCFSLLIAFFLQCYQCDSTTDGPEACNDDPASRCEFQHYHVNWLEWSHFIQKTSKNGVSLEKKTSDMMIRGELKTCPPEQNAGCFIIESKNSTSVSLQKAFLWWRQYVTQAVLPRNPKYWLSHFSVIKGELDADVIRGCTGIKNEELYKCTAHEVGHSYLPK